MSENKRQIGNDWESVACQYLEKLGIRILERNFKSYRAGEIDIIAVDEADTLILAEVKYRRNIKSGMPQEAVGISKQRSICRAFDYYRIKHGIEYDRRVRFDVIAILGTMENHNITWIKNAFEYIGQG